MPLDRARVCCQLCPLLRRHRCGLWSPRRRLVAGLVGEELRAIWRTGASPLSKALRKLASWTNRDEHDKGMAGLAIRIESRKRVQSWMYERPPTSELSGITGSKMAD